MFLWIHKQSVKYTQWVSRDHALTIHGANKSVTPRSVEKCFHLTETPRSKCSMRIWWNMLFSFSPSKNRVNNSRLRELEPSRKSKKVRVIGISKQVTGYKEISKWTGEGTQVSCTIHFKLGARDTGCLAFDRKFRKFRMEGKW